LGLRSSTAKISLAPRTEPPALTGECVSWQVLLLLKKKKWQVLLKKKAGGWGPEIIFFRNGLEINENLFQATAKRLFMSKKILFNNIFN